MNESEDQESCSEASTAAKAGRKRTATKGGPKRKRKMLNKEEKSRVMLFICDVNLDDVLSYVKEAERHITENSARTEFWTCLQSSQQMVTELLRTLASLFATLYKSCDKGKDKYMTFQLEWHQRCSVFLLPPI